MASGRRHSWAEVWQRDHRVPFSGHLCLMVAPRAEWWDPALTTSLCHQRPMAPYFPE